MVVKKARQLKESELKSMAEEILSVLGGLPNKHRVLERKDMTEHTTAQLRDYLNQKYGVFDVKYHFETQDKYGVAYIMWLKLNR